MAQVLHPLLHTHFYRFAVFVFLLKIAKKKIHLHRHTLNRFVFTMFFRGEPREAFVHRHRINLLPIAITTLQCFVYHFPYDNNNSSSDSNKTEIIIIDGQSRTDVDAADLRFIFSHFT